MAKFNKQVVKVRKMTKAHDTVNRAGGLAHKQSDKLAITSLLLTSFAQSSYYESEANLFERVRDIIDRCPDTKYIAKAAIYARNEFGMRSITHIVAGEIAARVKGEEWVKNFIQNVVRRPDDMTEILSYYMSTYGKPIPNCLKKGLALAFGKFNEYQLAKYRAGSKEVSLVDVLNICHPKPNKENRKAMKMLVNDKLRSTDTWESMLTDAGQSDASETDIADKKADVWRKLLSEKKLGYFAALRNINNILKTEDDEIIDMLCSTLRDPKLIKSSLVLPFRYMTAMEAVKGNGSSKHNRLVLQAIERAIDISCSNVPMFDGDTLVVVDYSGSMGDGYDSFRGKGTLFASILAKNNNADFMIFGDRAKYLDYNLDESIITMTEKFMKHNRSSRSYHDTEVGYGTNLSSVFDTMNKKYDRVVIFSDAQTWMDNGRAQDVCRAKMNQFGKFKLYSFDLAGYGDMQFPEKDVFCIAGFSEKVFNIMQMFESDPTAMMTVIEDIEL